MAKETSEQDRPPMNDGFRPSTTQDTPPRLDAVLPASSSLITLPRLDTDPYLWKPVRLPIAPHYPSQKGLVRRAPYRAIRAKRRRLASAVLPKYCLEATGFVILSFLLVFGLLANYMYSYYLAQLSALQNIHLSSGFEESRIYDRNNRLLYEFTGFGRRDQVTLDQVSPVLIQATIDTEDKDFWTNQGVDFIGIVRAAYENIRSHRVVSGGSTITQQLVKNTLLNSETGSIAVNQTILNRKIPEAILSYGLTKRYSKQQILQLYLNTIYYGNLAYGIKAATYEYFGGETDPAKRVDVRHLDLAHASILAGLPQSPSVYNPLQHPQAAFARQKEVLEAMLSRLDITSEEARQAIVLSHQPGFFKSPHPMKLAPHVVDYVQMQLEQMFENGYSAINGGGLNIYTTLDLDLQDQVQEITRRHVRDLSGHHVNNGAAVVLNPHTGEILAMVGSVDYKNRAINGQFNAAAQGLLQPGSSFKPFAYATAFAKGWTPATVVLDAPTTFPANPGPYKPLNYDRKFHGLMTLRTALANSFNIPAIKVLEYAGIVDTIKMARAFGLSTLKDPGAYGLSLVLGGVQVTPLEMTAAYGVFATGGIRVKPHVIRRITTNTGEVLLDYTTRPPGSVRVISSQLAYLITDILKDNAARALEFGLDSPLRLDGDRPAAAKTGTTENFRDNWTIGYTPEYVVGAWVGNSDGSPMENIIGIDGAGPIWHDTMELVERNRPFRYFVIPDGLARVTTSYTGRLLVADQSPGLTDYIIVNAKPQVPEDGGFTIAPVSYGTPPQETQ